MTEKNRPMRILTGIAIILVVLGHIDCNILSVFGLFPYYSFHVLIFVFVSGYFYNPENENNIPKYIGKKVLHLLVPYYAWNLVYGIASTIAASKGFVFCNKISLFNFFIEPFLGGHQYGFNFAAWFVPALFMVEVLYILGRKILGLMHSDYERVILFLLLAAGIITVWLAKGGHVWGFLKTPGRILFMMPVYQFGRIYNTRIESVDTIASYIYLPIVIVLQVGVYLISGGLMNFSAVWCTSFGSYCFMPYITTITGIAFWLRISKLLSRIKPGRLIEIIGDYSFDIMMHHMTFVFLLNMLTYICIKGTKFEETFDLTQFRENINYVYLLSGISAWKSVYFVAAIIGSVGMGILTDTFKKNKQR